MWDERKGIVFDGAHRVRDIDGLGYSGSDAEVAKSICYGVFLSREVHNKEGHTHNRTLGSDEFAL